jgi:hypothetical protein
MQTRSWSDKRWKITAHKRFMSRFLRDRAKIYAARSEAYIYRQSDLFLLRLVTVIHPAMRSQHFFLFFPFILALEPICRVRRRGYIRQLPASVAVVVAAFVAFLSGLYPTWRNKGLINWLGRKVGLLIGKGSFFFFLFFYIFYIVKE